MNTEFNKHYSLVPFSVCFQLAQSREATSALHLLPQELPLHTQVAKKATQCLGGQGNKMLCSLMSMLGAIRKSPELLLHFNQEHAKSWNILMEYILLHI